MYQGNRYCQVEKTTAFTLFDQTNRMKHKSTIVNFYLPYKLNFRKISAFIYKYWEKDKLQVAFVTLNSLESLRECNILTDMTGIRLKAPVIVETDVRRLLQLCRDSINLNWM